MDGLMMDRPLLVKQIAERAERVFADREIVARTQDGLERSTYAQVVARARRLAARWRSSGSGPATASRPSPGTRSGISSSTWRCPAWAPSSTR